MSLNNWHFISTRLSALQVLVYTRHPSSNARVCPLQIQHSLPSPTSSCRWHCRRDSSHKLNVTVGVGNCRWKLSLEANRTLLYSSRCWRIPLSMSLSRPMATPASLVWGVRDALSMNLMLLPLIWSPRNTTVEHRGTLRNAAKLLVDESYALSFDLRHAERSCGGFVGTLHGWGCGRSLALCTNFGVAGGVAACGGLLALCGRELRGFVALLSVSISSSYCILQCPPSYSISCMS
jgi:hypothetical protein